MKWTEEEIKLGIEMIENGKTFIEIADLLNKTQNSVTKKFNRLGFKSSYHLNGIYNKYLNIDWVTIQESHDDGLTYREIIKNFKLTPQSISWAKLNGKLIFRTHAEATLIRKKKGGYNKSKKYGFELYRLRCQFNFNLKDFPNKFDFELIKKYGWYSPTNKKNNLKGVSRDHMLSIKDGFINNIPPYIIKHPANCRLILHSQNSSKNSKSIISLDELVDKINKW